MADHTTTSPSRSLPDISGLHCDFEAVRDWLAWREGRNARRTTD